MIKTGIIVKNFWLELFIVWLRFIWSSDLRLSFFKLQIRLRINAHNIFLKGKKRSWKRSFYGERREGGIFSFKGFQTVIALGIVMLERCRIAIVTVSFGDESLHLNSFHSSLIIFWKKIFILFFSILRIFSIIGSFVFCCILSVFTLFLEYLKNDEAFFSIVIKLYKFSDYP